MHPATRLLLLSLATISLPATAAVTATATHSEVEPDRCFADFADGLEAVERTCSDVIAGLVNLPDLTPEEHMALVSAYNNRAIARTRSGETDAAAEDFGQALTLAPDSWALYLNRGNLMLARNDPQAALLDYQRARDLHPEAGSAVGRNSALAYRGLGDPLSAQQSLELSTPAATVIRVDGHNVAEPSDQPR